ncbi:hypothetical protein EJ03DRAFT_353596 [Teratosphaeria nubilosa]|uniref:Zn(2)-C6 fungal-type domain-containing protein n=1 Tax=Teratosphaeria nubilosa TaxID=161662 RepID=A0A6G1L322_9PEZI|nr:hypothetical protein EJ03DRAFT_353596 [Teratosphaeria nubilosa]
MATVGWQSQNGVNYFSDHDPQSASRCTPSPPATPTSASRALGTRPAIMNASNLDPALQAPQPPPPPPPAPPQTQLPPQSAQPPQYGGQARPAHAGTSSDPYPPPPYFFPSPSQQPSLSSQASPAAGFGIPSPHAAGGGGETGDDAKRPRACEACRGLKVRCDQDPAHPEIPCKRCAKAGRQCIITQPSRKRQKKADSRVAELERKLDALTAALQQQGQGQCGAPGGAAEWGLVPLPAYGGQQQQQQQQQQQHFTPQSQAPMGGAGNGMPPHKRRRVEGTPGLDSADATGKPHLSRTTSGSREDPLSREMQEITRPWGPTDDDPRGYLYRTSPEEFVARVNSLIGPEMAARVWQRYITKLAPNLPAVVFPPETTAEQVFKEKPILYVCILSAASFGTVPLDTHKALAAEAVGAIADCVVRHGAKSLELIQAMQIIALYYKPPEIAERTNFYQIIHMAAVMALDIGLGKRYNPAKSRRGFGGPGANFAPGPGRSMPQDSDTLEARRAWLTCYYLCASASMVLRRPNLVRWTNYMRECIEVLESHPDAFPSDKLFIQHVKIQHICEDIGLQFLMDDNTATNISITDPKVTYALTVLEDQLKDWREGIPKEHKDDKGLGFFEQVTSLYLHEIALHFNHNIEDFRVPFTEESLKSVHAGTSDTLTANQVAALESCLKAAHGILDVFLSFDQDTAKCLPMLLFFVRCVYAIVILIKMHVAVCTPNSELGKMMRPDDLKVESYIERLVGCFRYVQEDGSMAPHPKIMRILGVLREWFGRHKAVVNGGVVRVEQQRGGQEGLQMLRQVGAGGSHQQGPSTSSSTAWTFDTPGVMDWRKQPPPSHPDTLLPKWKHQPDQPSPLQPHPQPQGQPQQRPPNLPPPRQPTPSNHFSFLPPSTTPPSLQAPNAPPAPFTLDALSNGGDYGWGSGFEQAMDMALGGVDGLQGGGGFLDQWFLGEGLAPFGGVQQFPGGDLSGMGGSEGGTGSW